MAQEKLLQFYDIYNEEVVDDVEKPKTKSNKE
jgi:hypothetical protein